MLSNILAEQCLMIVQSVLILIGALKKAGSGAVDGVAVKYCLDLISNKMYMTFYVLYADIVCFFHRSEMSTVQIMIQISFDTIQLHLTPFFFGLYYVILIP